MPSFIDSTIIKDGQEYWVINQQPAPGTVYSCPQSVIVRVEDSSGPLSPDPWSSLTIHLVDKTPPLIDATLNGTSSPHVSFGGVLRYVSPVAVIPNTIISDSCDAQPDIEALLDGEPYTLGDPVLDRGLHILHIVATDASGNQSTLNTMFEIQPRPSKTAATVVESAQYEVDDTGLVATLEVAMVLGSSHFDHGDVRLSSLRLMAADADGEWYNVAPITLRDAFNDECPIIDHQNVAAVKNNCYWHLTFRGEFAAMSMPETPASFTIVGVTEANGALTLEFGARAPSAPDPTPVDTLLGIIDVIQPCGNPAPPEPEPPVPRDSIVTIINSSQICGPIGTPATGAGCGTGSGSGGALNVWVNPIPLAGQADATANSLAGSACGPLTGQCGPLTGGQIAIVQFVGNCCDCSVKYRVSANVSPTASASGSGTFWTYAYAFGAITVSPPCGGSSSAAVEASVLFSSNVNPPVNPDLRTVNITPPVNCIEIGCHDSTRIIGATGHVLAQASASDGGTAHAQAVVNGAIIQNIVNPTFADCGPEPCIPEPEP